MKSLSFLLLLIGLVCFGCQSSVGDSDESTPPVQEAIEEPPQRIISLNGTLTEILYTAGLQDQIVAVDRTSTYPEAAQQLTNLGHLSQISSEGLLALEPTLILVDAEHKNNEVLAQMEQAGIQVAYIEVPQTLDGSLEVMDQISSLTGKTLDQTALKTVIDENKTKLQQLIGSSEQKPKVLFIYARGSQMLMIGGKNTFAESMIQIAGGEPVVQDLEGFKPLTPEGLVAYQPDVLLLFDKGLASLGDAESSKSGIDGLLEVPGVAQTPAGKNKAIYTFEGLYLSGFGPRASAAAVELAEQLHPPKQ